MYHRAMTLAQSRDRSVGLPLGPDSLVWQFFADHRMALLGPRAAVLQNMLPSLGQGVEDHSVWFAETLARLQRSIPPIFGTVYGTEDANAGVQVRDFHKHIKGRLPDGRPYSALNPETYYWAHATFVEHVITATDTFIRRLTDAEKEQLFAESITWFERYDVSATGTPRTYAEFQDYWDHALAERLTAHRTAAYGVGYVTRGWPRPRQVPAPLWFLVRRPLNTFSAFITTGGMPERCRVLLDLPWDDARERRYRRFAALCRRLDPLYRRLPGSLRLHPIALRAYRREGRRA
jgi:uncharacterized protein (DUF2236 family)